MFAAIPIFEAKNKLPLFIHQVEQNGPVFISRRNKSVAVLISLDDYNDLVHHSKQQQPTAVERIAAFKKRNGWPFTDDEIDTVFANVRDTTPVSFESHVFDGILED